MEWKLYIFRNAFIGACLFSVHVNLGKRHNCKPLYYSSIEQYLHEGFHIVLPTPGVTFVVLADTEGYSLNNTFYLFIYISVHLMHSFI
jgi:hypothetical protein